MKQFRQDVRRQLRAHGSLMPARMLFASLVFGASWAVLYLLYQLHP